MRVSVHNDRPRSGLSLKRFAMDSAWRCPTLVRLSVVHVLRPSAANNATTEGGVDLIIALEFIVLIIEFTFVFIEFTFERIEI